MTEYWVAAFGLMLVLEGLTPFLFPEAWRETLRKIAQMQEGQIRFLGLTMMLVGLLVIVWMK